MKIQTDKSKTVFTRVPAKFLGKLCRSPEIRVEFLNCGSQPLEGQIEAAKEIAERGEDYYKTIVKESVRYWNQSLKEDPKWFEGFEPLEGEADLCRKLSIGTIYIHANVEDRKGVRVGFAGDWELDEEHAYGILFQGSKMLAVGHQSEAFDDDTPCADEEFNQKEEIALLTEQLKMMDEAMAFWNDPKKAVGKLGLKGMIDPGAMEDKVKQALPEIAQQRAAIEARLKKLKSQKVD